MDGKNDIFKPDFLKKVRNINSKEYQVGKKYGLKNNQAPSSKDPQVPSSIFVVLCFILLMFCDKEIVCSL